MLGSLFVAYPPILCGVFCLVLVLRYTPKESSNTYTFVLAFS